MLISEYESFSSEQDLAPPASKHPRVQQDETQKSKSLLWQICDEMMEEESDSEASPESMECVVDTYLKELNQPRKSNPLQYWKECQQLWPILVSLASKYLCAPPSSVASEIYPKSSLGFATYTRKHSRVNILVHHAMHI